jgi:mRNA interferase HigB
VIARRTIARFAETLAGHKDQRAVKAALESWFQEALHAGWRNPADVQKHYRSASIVSSDRVVFNIKGNDYRLVTAIDYKRQIVFIKWIGTHSGYDKIDVKTVQYEN